jgi:hypothetical protein
MERLFVEVVSFDNIFHRAELCKITSYARGLLVNKKTDR